MPVCRALLKVLPYGWNEERLAAALREIAEPKVVKNGRKQWQPNITGGIPAYWIPVKTWFANGLPLDEEEPVASRSKEDAA